LTLEVTKEFSWVTLFIANHIEFIIHVIFNESNESKLSDSLVQNLNMNKHRDEEEERLKETNVTKESAQE